MCRTHVQVHNIIGNKTNQSFLSFLLFCFNRDNHNYNYCDNYTIIIIHLR